MRYVYLDIVDYIRSDLEQFQHPPTQCMTLSVHEIDMFSFQRPNKTDEIVDR